VLEAFNECTILVCGYHLFLFTDYIEDPYLKFNIGWSIIGILMVNLLVNLSVAIYDMLQQIGDYLAKNCSKKKSKKKFKKPFNNKVMHFNDTSLQLKSDDIDKSEQKYPRKKGKKGGESDMEVTDFMMSAFDNKTFNESTQQQQQPFEMSPNSRLQTSKIKVGLAKFS